MSHRIVKPAVVGALVLSLLCLANLSAPTAEQADQSDKKAVLDKINKMLGELEALKASVHRQEKRLPEGEKKGDKSTLKPEAKKYPTGYKPLPPAARKALHAAAFKRHGHLLRHLVNNATPPPKFDCVDLGWVPPVRNQDPNNPPVCIPGDCYLVSAVDAITCAFIKRGWGKNDDSFKISDQYGLDCTDFPGCGGGDEAPVIADCKANGIPAERYIDLTTGNKVIDYGPYTAIPGQCQLKPSAKMWKIQDWGYVAGDQDEGPATLDQIKAALMTWGVLSIALPAKNLYGYPAGRVISSLGGGDADHAITMVGWDDSKQAVHCRNNWGTDWGENGYCWISYKALPQITEVIWVLAPPLPQTDVPVFTSAATATIVVGTAFSFTVSATNSPTSYDATGLPPGLNIDRTTGVISGTPTAVGTSTVNLTANNTTGPGTGTLTITVTSTGTPAITSAGTAAGVVGTAFNFPVTATNSPTLFAATGLPPGLNIDKLTGVISGTPTAAGTTPVNLTVTNAVGPTQGTLTITVTSVPAPQPCPAPDYSVEIRARIDWWTKNYPKYADPLKRP